MCLLASFSGEDQGGAEKLFVAQQIRRPDLASLTVHVRRHRMTQELHDGMACIVRGHGGCAVPNQRPMCFVAHHRAWLGTVRRSSEFD